ncbi:hypothetical protein DCAR_0206646 [Daucus carota subsp. sativus]|uniref:Uncharacterized protein n=1 Tax=Daucus carota subsp. sativus TaxID=79200 RepID=A0A166DC51_DAUCS|nr:hypothetical protein DCAR_0206646 [Daucus carota subsp. sativus]
MFKDWDGISSMHVTDDDRDGWRSIAFRRTWEFWEMKTETCNRRLTIVSSLPGSLLPRPRVESASSPPQDRLSESDISESGRLNLFTEPVEQLQNIDKEPLSVTKSDLKPGWLNFLTPVEQLKNIDKEPLSLTESDLKPGFFRHNP